MPPFYRIFTFLSAGLITNRSKSPQHFKFWKEPALAAKMWLHYNQSLLSFIKENRDSCIISTQSAALDSAPLLDAVNELGQFHLDVETLKPYFQNLIQEKSSIRLSAMLDAPLRKQLNSIWQQLLMECDFKTKQEQTSWYFDGNTALISLIMGKKGVPLDVSHERESVVMASLVEGEQNKQIYSIDDYYCFYSMALKKLSNSALVKHYCYMVDQCKNIHARMDLASRIIDHLQQSRILIMHSEKGPELQHIPYIEAHQTRLFPRGLGADMVNITGLSARCDWVVVSDYKEPMVLLVNQKNISKPKTIFISLRNPFTALSYFYNEVLHQLTSPFYLITGSEDVTIPQQIDKRTRGFTNKEEDMIQHILEHPQLVRWHAENLSGTTHEKFRPLPMGLVYPDSQPRPELPCIAVSPQIKRQKTVFCAHRIREGEQWETRRHVTALAKTEWKLFCYVVEDELSESDFFTQCKCHSFVICAEGGGIDPSPKAWQSLLYGAIPIIRSTGVKSAYSNLPVVFVDDWKPDAITPAKLELWKQQLSPYFDEPEKRIEILKKLGLDYWWANILKDVLDVK